MSPRGTRLVLASAGLSWAAAALAWAAPALPEGLAAACAPGLVARELLAGLVVWALLAVPSLLADETGRPPEDHTALLAILPAAPAVAALAVAGGASPLALLPAAGLLLACDLASSSYLRADPAGRCAVGWSAGAAALLAAVPIAAWGAADLGGWDGAAELFRFSPLLAVRDLSGGWPAVAPAALLLVAVAALLRLRPRAVPAAAILLGAAVIGLPSAASAEVAALPEVLVVGQPREGPYAEVVGALRREGAVVGEVEEVPRPLPWTVEALVFARPPRSAEEEASWREAAAGVAAAGGRVVPWPGAGVASDPPRPSVSHPARGTEPGVNAALFRVPFPSPARSLPGRTLAFLTLLAAAFMGTTVMARRRGYGGGRAGLSLSSVAAVGVGLLFLPGVLGEPFRVDRLVIEERYSGSDAVRRIEVVRVERLRTGGGEFRLVDDGLFSWAEVRYSAESEESRAADGAVRLAAPGRYALFARVSGGSSPAPGGPFLAETGTIAGLEEWRRSTDPRVSLAGWLLAACARGPARFAVPAEGPAAVVVHP